jgi:hypothetical protein
MITGFKGIVGLSPEVLGPRGRYLTGLLEPCGALPRKCLSIYSFIDDFPPGKSPQEPNSHVPLVSAIPRTFIEASRPEEVRALLKFGRDSNWPLKVTFSCALDEINSLPPMKSVGKS